MTDVDRFCETSAATGFLETPELFPPELPHSTSSPFSTKPIIPDSTSYRGGGGGAPLYTAVISPKEMAAHEAVNFKNVKGVYKNCRGIWAAQWTDERGQRHTKYFNPKYFPTEAEARHEAFRFKIHIAREIELRGGVQKRRTPPNTSIYRGGDNNMLDCSYRSPFSSPCMTNNETGHAFMDNFQLNNNELHLTPDYYANLTNSSSSCSTSAFTNFGGNQPTQQHIIDHQNSAPAPQMLFGGGSPYENLYGSTFRGPATISYGDNLIPLGTTLCGCGCGALAIAPARFACHHRCGEQQPIELKRESQRPPLFPTTKQNEKEDDGSALLLFNFMSSTEEEAGTSAATSSKSYSSSSAAITGFPFTPACNKDAYSSYPANAASAGLEDNPPASSSSETEEIEETESRFFRE